MPPVERTAGLQSGERLQVHPNTYLNEYVTHHVLDFLEKSGLRQQLEEQGCVTLAEGASTVRHASFEHLAHVGIVQKGEGNRYTLIGFPQQLPGFSLVEDMADLQRQALDEGVALRHKVDRGSALWPLVAYGGQCLMLSSYAPLLEHLWELDQGIMEYGWGKALYRRQPDNSNGSGVMMKQAAGRIADKVIELYGEDNVAVLELGSGNARQLVEIMKHVPQGRTPPLVIASDMDINTRPTAEKLFDDNGLADAFVWEQIYMGDADDLAKVKEQLSGKRVIILVGYIFHESRALARQAFNAIGSVFPDAVIGASEYYVQQDITDDVPLWFQTIHSLSGQELFAYYELLQFAGGYGYGKIDEVVHQRRDGQPPLTLNSTVFLQRQS